MQRRTFLESLSSALAIAQAAPKAANGIGFAERDITPEIGMEQPGGYSKVFHKTLHDPCKVRAAVFNDGAKRVALVGVDALMLPRTLVVAARAEVQNRCGIEPGAVMLAASHSHSSGPVGMVQPGEFDHASALVRQLAYENSSAAHAGYLQKVQTEIVRAVCDADAKRAALRTGFGTGLEDKAAFNRRFFMKNGLTSTHPGKGNPMIVKAAGPIDPAVTVIGCWDEKNNLTGCVVNYACHATTSPGGISANWIYYLEKTLRGTFGTDVVVVFLNGFCGDVTQVDNLDPHVNPGAEKWAQIVGGRVGAEAVKVLLSMTADQALHVDHAQRVARMDRRIPSAERVRRSMELVQQDPKTVGVTEWIFAKEIVLLDAQIARERQVEVECQSIQIGPAVLLAAPGEMFCQLGLDLRQRSKFPFTVPVELANGSVGYVPTLEALGPTGGGYETRLTSYSNLEVAAGPKMVETLAALAARFTPAAVPEPRRAPPAKDSWSYGNLPPELF